jgi:hypothetical protein
LAGRDPELKRVAYAAFRERETAHRNEQYVAVVAKRFTRRQGWRPKPRNCGNGYSSWDTYDQDGNEVSLKEALQRAGVGNGENVKIRAWSKSEKDELKAYFDEKMSIRAIKVLMKMGYAAVERKIKEKGWEVWRGRGKNGYLTTLWVRMVIPDKLYYVYPHCVS